jgi:uncharacterized protein YdcH (DUF465 family)
MFIYNVTVKIDPSIKDEWLNWMLTEHIKEVLNTKLFNDAHFYELLEPINEDDNGITYIVQYHAPSKSMYNEYINKHAIAMREKGYAKFGNRFIAFRSLMKHIN